MRSIYERSTIEHKNIKLSRDIFIVLLVSYLIEGIYFGGISAALQHAAGNAHVISVQLFK